MGDESCLRPPHGHGPRGRPCPEFIPPFICHRDSEEHRLRVLAAVRDGCSQQFYYVGIAGVSSACPLPLVPARSPRPTRAWGETGSAAPRGHAPSKKLGTRTSARK